MRLPLLALALLAACARAPDPAPSVPDYRRDGAPIGSVVVLDSARFSGSWVQIAQYPGACPAERLTLTARDGGFLAERNCNGEETTESWSLSAPGRIETPDGTLWILWIDQGYRTAVLGRPEGDFGVIWNRNQSIPADRRKAAREILDFNGYDLGQLVENR
ncbi:MAG: lipocalin [Rhodobacterales bacterium]|nr:MAG: lipocalin [Rhodobacterales bacterium]